MTIGCIFIIISQITVSGTLLEDAERQWAAPTDPVFDIVPPGCNKHISSIYAQLGRPQINFYLFWDVYNQLHDAVDAEFLIHSSTGVFSEEHSCIPEDDPNVTEMPLSHLHSCQFGEDGVPAGQLDEEGEADCCLTPSLAYTSAHISLDDDLVVEFTDDEADEIY